MTNPRPTVFIVNDGPHDFSEAKRFGEIVFLSHGPIDRYATNQMYRTFMEKLQDSSPEDYILSTALTQMNMIATAIMAHKHGRVNILIHHGGNGYKDRTIMLTPHDSN